MSRLPYLHTREAAASMPRRTPATATTHYVDSCADDGSPNSLRSLIELSPDVHSGDTIDLTQLPMMCSKITLSSSFVDPAITVVHDTLYLQGPGADQLTIDGNGYSSVFRHYGGGKLVVKNLTVANGYMSASGPPHPLPRGGCIFSSGSVVLVSSVVTQCSAVSTSDVYEAMGGAIYSQGDLRMYFSTISNSEAFAFSVSAGGGGAIVVGELTANYSTISGNAATAPSDTSWAGGINVQEAATILGSTISSNRADVYAGIDITGGSVMGVDIVNSTVSRNVARDGAAGISSLQPITIANSTVTGNETLLGSPDVGSGVTVGGTTLYIRSSIVAANFAAFGPADIGGIGVIGYAGGYLPPSKDNLIVASSLTLPPGTITDCPRLDPLADNGGRTLTHKLNSASPAVEKGNNDRNLDSDQRGTARVVGAHADIGAVERALADHDERIFLGRFDAKCEW